jgi:ubiquinol-cytochrome c reductase cytochrome c1 subunit
MRRLLPALAVLALTAGPAFAQEEAPAPPAQKWSFDGIFGTYDRASLQRGFQIYKEVCSACHSMNLLSYRNLEEIGLSATQVKAIAASIQVPTLNSSGETVMRPALPSDTFKAPFASDEAAKAANDGAIPPDQSDLVKARAGGPDYVYAILTGYKPPPPGVKIAPGTYYNEYFPTHAIHMPPPLTAGRVTYADGTKATLPQEAHDVTTFLTWASHPNLELRKRTGVKVIIFLLFLTGMTYGVKRKVWSNVH